VKLIIYIPAFNEEANICNVINKLPKALANIDTIQYLVVDDGSVDKTAELAKSVGAQVIQHKKNQGVGAAFYSASQFALESGVDILVGIDADGQFDPNEIHSIIEPILAQQADMAIGNRFTSGLPRNMPKFKYWGNLLVAKMIGLICGQNFQDVSCGFRAYSRDILLWLNLHGSFTYTHETIISSVYEGKSVVECPISVRYDPERKSRVAKSIFRYAIKTSAIIFRVLLDYQPMRVFGAIGGFLILIGVGFVAFLLGHYALTGAFTPYKAYGFIGLGFIIFGMLVFLLALIADMIKRVRANQNRLLYEIKKMK
jgi:glycosyltransferase involved in cell wall biosynthesis